MPRCSPQDLAPAAPGPLRSRGALHSVEAISAGDRARDRPDRAAARLQPPAGRPAEVLDLNAPHPAIEPMLQPLIGENIRLVLQLDPRDRPHPGRSRPARPDPRQPRGERPRRDARRRHGDDRDRQRSTSTRAYAIEHFEVNPGRYVVMAVSDTGVGHGPRHARAHLRAVLHDQGRRQGHRASASRRSTASSGRPAGTSGSTRSQARARRSGSTSRVTTGSRRTSWHPRSPSPRRARGGSSWSRTTTSSAT